MGINGKVDVACIVLNYNDANTTSEMVNRIKDYHGIGKIYVVDNGSTDDSLKILGSLESPHVSVLSTGNNGGYGYGNNFGVKLAYNEGFRFSLIANPDVEFDNQLVDLLRTGFNENVNAAIIAPGKMNGDYRAWSFPTWFSYTFSALMLIGRLFKENGTAYTSNGNYAEVDCVPGSLLMVDSEAFISVGGYDERMFLYCEEVVLGFKFAQKGKKTYVVKEANFVHNHSVSIKKSISSAVKRKRMLLNNRLFFLREYKSVGIIRMTITKFVYWISMGEEVVKSFLLNFLR